MARRKDHTHAELREMALVAARRIAVRKGLGGLTAREVARRIEYSPGTLYNVFESFDDLIVQMNGRTLDELYQFMTAEKLGGDTETALKTLAHRYIKFTTENANLWSVLFDPSLLRTHELPAWYYEKVNRLVNLVAEPLEPMFSSQEYVALRHTVRVLWSGLHGICTLVSAQALDEEESATALADTLIDKFVAGLRVVKP